MENNFNFDKLTNKFFQYLSSLGISNKTHKNYRSDINHFTGWLLLKLKTFGIAAEELSEALPFISKKTATEYKDYLSQNNISRKTINRRLSTLRHLGRFLLETQILDFNFSEEISNISARKPLSPIHPIVKQFEQHLVSEKVSESTIKNYMTDVKQFLAFIENYKKLNTN